MKIVDVTKNRTKLFNTIAIETGSKCNRKCVFCPNVGTDRGDDWLDTEMVQKIIDELVAIDYRGCVQWFSYNEPTRDQRLLDFIKQVNDKMPKTSQVISTNGDYIRGPEFFHTFIKAGLRQMQVNIYSSSMQPTSQAAAEKRYAKVVEWRNQAIVEDPRIKPEGAVYTWIKPGEIVIKVVPKFGATTGVDALQNRAGNIPNFMPATPEPLDKMCIRPFRHLNINWKGDSILCCNDYHGEINFGNVKNMSLLDIWDSPAFNVYRLFMQNKNRDLPLCDKCDYNGGYYQFAIHKVTFGDEVDKELLGQKYKSVADIEEKLETAIIKHLPPEVVLTANVVKAESKEGCCSESSDKTCGCL